MNIEQLRIKTIEVLEYKIIFPDENPRALKDYINGIKKEILFKASCFFSRLSSDSVYRDDYHQLLLDWFQEGNIEFLNEVRLKIEDYEKDKRVTILNSYSSLRLFELILQEWEEEKNPKSDLESEIDLFKAYLLLNKEYVDKDNTALETTKNLSEKCYLQGLFFTRNFRDYDIINYKLDKSIICQFQKAYLLFEYLSSNDKFNELLNIFYSYYSCKDWKHYLEKVFSLVLSLTKTTEKGNIEIKVQKNNEFQANCEFLEKFSISDDNTYGEEIDFLKIRSNPLFKIEFGRYLVICDLFLSEKLFKGLYFKLKEFNQSLTNPFKNLKSIYCDLFSEKKLLYELMEYVFKNRYVKFSGEELKNAGITAEPDYYIRNRNKVLLFESKDILIPADVKNKGDFNDLRKSFRRKLYFDVDSNNKKIKPKAILQLIRNIKRLLNNEDFIIIDKEIKNKTLNIYPILVLHDNLYNVFGMNKLINFWFYNELKKLKNKGYEIKKVRPLTIIDIDTIIYLQEALRMRKCCFDKFIDKYQKNLINYNLKKLKTQEIAFEIIQNSLLSFSDYLENENIIKKNITPPLVIKKFGRNILTPVGST